MKVNLEETYDYYLCKNNNKVRVLFGLPQVGSTNAGILVLVPDEKCFVYR